MLLLYVAGALEPGEAAELRQHLLTGCPACAGALAEAETVVHRLPETLKPVDVPRGAWERIEKRIAVKDAVMGPSKSKAGWMGWVIAAGIAVVAAIVMESNYLDNVHSIAAMTQEMTGLKKDLVTAELNRDQAQSELAAVQSSEKEMTVRLTSLETQVKTLSQQNAQVHLELAAARQGEMDRLKHIMDSQQYEVASAGMKDVQGMVYVCRGDGQCMLVASNLKPLPAGKTFEAWMIDDKGKPMPAGTFSMDGNGMAMHLAKIPTEMSGKGTFAVTEEPEGGVQSPTGNLLFKAEIQ